MVAAQPQQPQSAPALQQPALKASAASGQACGPLTEQQQESEPDPASKQQQEDVLHFNWEQRAQARSCMQTLVLALADDPVNAYFSGSRRRRFVKDEVKGYLKALRGATNFIATPDSCAVALWQLLPQETPRNELWAGWTRILRVPPRLWRQLLRLELHYESAHDAVAAAVGSYYYLSFIGTRPEARGRGLGGRLLAHITRRADAEGRWCLLEATSEASQALYARHGFVTYEAFRVSSHAPPVFLMKRAPAAAAAPPPPAALPGAVAPVAVAAVVVAEATQAAGGSAVAAGSYGLAEALAAKMAAAGSAAKAAGPASECGSEHSLIGTADEAAEGHGHEEQQQQQGLLRLEEEASSSSSSSSEGGSDSESEEEEEASRAAGAVVCAGVMAEVVMGGDARVVIRSNSSAGSFKELAEAAAAAAAAGSDSSKCCDMCGSSSSAGAGGPSTGSCC